MDDLDADLVGHLDLHQGVFQRLDGTGGVALDDDVEHVHLGLGELLLEAFERDDLAAFRELRGAFRPEFLNRVDELIVFHPLDEENILRIAGSWCSPSPRAWPSATST